MPDPVNPAIGRTLEDLEDIEDDASEPRSFDPPRKPPLGAQAGAMSDTPEALKRATDGDEQKSRPLE